MTTLFEYHSILSYIYVTHLRDRTIKKWSKMLSFTIAFQALNKIGIPETER